jgi:hypothetical protein
VGSNTRSAINRLEVAHEDIHAPDTMEVPLEVIRDRLQVAEMADVVSDVPLPKLVVSRGSGKIDLSGGLKRFFKSNPNKLDQLYESIVERAIAGDHNATKLVFDRVEGAVPQRVGVGQLSTEQIAEMLQLDVDRED